MNSGPANLETVSHLLIGWDGSESALNALLYGISMGEKLSVDSIAVLNVHSVDEMRNSANPSASLASGMIAKEEAEKVEKMLADVLIQELPEGMNSVKLESVGDAGKQIVNTGKKAKLTVVGSHGRHGISRLLLGSVSEYVLRHSSGPVLVHHAPDASPPKRILFASDGSSNCDSAEEWAKELAIAYSSELVVITVVSPSTKPLHSLSSDINSLHARASTIKGMHQINREIQERLEKGGVKMVSGEVLEGFVGPQVSDRARNGDLIIVGRAKRPWPFPFGPGKVAEFCVRNCSVNILIAP